ncbi:aspartate/glutamate racemase family protein [Legionella jamestowniensis]|uniref:Hydantoin racemase n=1 Tax=Legionella jamestowniensis TaxID=455 RepID=A0A0W0UJ08_9GAMM|nr:aspartate/glutamate racemase family protein [Legionella jamestowniensis]KTD07888.1 hydantoin racemase [Legionella jamestowniensis]OCH99021.1 hydantoin racemase [Legionella jamestowniensis]SFL63685.1 Asp/Glu/hydantoin racemase [Legionella jamestowniensis DSM 19215]
MTHIRVILPGYNTKVLNMDMLKPYVTPELEISIAYVNLAVDAVRHELDMALLAPGLIKQAMLAEKENVSAIVIDLMAEIALAPLREAVSIPVVSLPETTMHVATMMGRKFAIINTTDELTAIQENLAKNYGLREHLACVQGIQLDPHADYTSEKTIENLVEQCADAVINKQADTLIFGSGRLIAYRDKINKGLHERGIAVTIIEPLPTGIYFAKFLADAKITHSKRVYRSPDEKTLEIYKQILGAFDSAI